MKGEFLVMRISDIEEFLGEKEKQYLSLIEELLESRKHLQYVNKYNRKYTKDEYIVSTIMMREIVTSSENEDCITQQMCDIDGKLTEGWSMTDFKTDNELKKIYGNALDKAKKGY